MLVFRFRIIVFLFFTTYGVCYGNPDAKRLYDDLLSNYNRLIRPVDKNNNTVLVKLGLRLSQLIDLVQQFSESEGVSYAIDIIIGLKVLKFLLHLLSKFLTESILITILLITYVARLVSSKYFKDSFGYKTRK